MDRRKGFTLVELLIVIVIIAILAAITVVAYNGIQKRAKDTSLRSDMASASKTVSLWMVDHSIQEMRQITENAGSSSSAWILGDEADNAVSESSARWNAIAGLPRVKVSPTTTLEVIPQYSGGNLATEPTVNDRMAENNAFCISGAVRGGTYGYRPGSGQPAHYDELLYFDSLLGRVVTIEEIGQAYDNGDPTVCTVHLLRWRQANA